MLDALPPATTRRLRVERDVLHALTFLDADVDRANEHLRSALVVAQPERLIRSIIDPGPDVHKLLMSSTPDAHLQSFVEELITAAGRTVAPRRSEAAHPTRGTAQRSRDHRACATCAAA